jgi:hypothetical protein
MFAGDYRVLTYMTLGFCLIAGPVLSLLNGLTIWEALYVGVPMGLFSGLFVSAVWWRREELLRRRRR